MTRTTLLNDILFICACLAWVSGVVFRIPLGNGLVLLPLDVAVGGLALVQMWDIKGKGLRAHIWGDPIGRLFVYFCAFASASLVVTALLHDPISLDRKQFFVSLMYIVRVVAYGQVAWLFSQHRSQIHKRRYLSILLISGMSKCLLGYVQYFLYGDLRNLYYAGWDEHVARMFGTVLDPNFMGALLVVAMATLHVWQAEITSKMKSAHSQLLYTHVSMFIVLLSVGVVLTYSRGSYLMLMTYGLIVYGGRIKKPARVLSILLVGIVLVVIVACTQTRSEGTNLLRTASIQSRITEYQQASVIIAHNPIRGVGFNAYRYAQQARHFLPDKTWVTDHAGAGVPNAYLFVLATTGIVGFLLCMKMGALLLIQLRQYDEPYVFALVVALGVHALTENTFFYPFIMFPVAVLVAYVRSTSSATTAFHTSAHRTETPQPQHAQHHTR